MAERPRKIRVEGETVDVRFLAPLKKFPDGYPTGGKHTPATREKRALIEIAPGQTHSGERITLLHEVLHEAADRAHLRGMLPYKDHETVFTSIDTWLFMILYENPELVAWLMEERPR